MAAVSLSWDHNMAAVTSCENALYTGNELQATLKRGEEKETREALPVPEFAFTPPRSLMISCLLFALYTPKESLFTG